MVLELKVCSRRCSAIVDTAACSIWAYQTWFCGIVDQLETKDETATAVYGRRIKGTGGEILTFELWGSESIDSVSIIENLL